MVYNYWLTPPMVGVRFIGKILFRTLFLSRLLLFQFVCGSSTSPSFPVDIRLPMRMLRDLVLACGRQPRRC